MGSSGLQTIFRVAFFCTNQKMTHIFRPTSTSRHILVKDFIRALLFIDCTEAKWFRRFITFNSIRIHIGTIQIIICLPVNVYIQDT